MQHCLFYLFISNKKQVSLCSYAGSIVRLSSILRICLCFIVVIDFSRRSAKNGFARLGSDPDLFCFQKKKKRSFKEEKKHFGTLVTKSQSSFSKHVLPVVFESFCVANKNVTLEGALYCFVTYHMNSGAQPQVKCTQ